MKMRLDRWLATVSDGSRSEVKQWIRGGQAAVNGRVILDPALSFETERDCPVLRGKALDGRVMRHVMLNKPAGLLTAARDSRQPTVMDLLPETFRGIGCMPVGRLDKDTTGLLLLTCDGELNHRLLSPGRHVEKRYRALVDGELTEADVVRHVMVQRIVQAYAAYESRRKPAPQGRAWTNPPCSAIRTRAA